MPELNFLIKTPRLGLRLIEKDDVSLINELECDPLVRCFFPKEFFTYEDTEKQVKDAIRNYLLFGLPSFAIHELSTGRFIGVVSFTSFDDHAVEVGYALFCEYRGLGYATEALKAALQFARDTFEECDIVGFAMVENTASSHVMEKCGMHFQKMGLMHGSACQFYQMHIP